MFIGSNPHIGDIVAFPLVVDPWPVLAAKGKKGRRSRHTLALPWVEDPWPVRAVKRRVSEAEGSEGSKIPGTECRGVTACGG